MTRPDFPSNSKSTPPAEPRKIERVTTDEVTARRKSVGKRLKDALIGGDSKSVMQYVIVEVLIPQAKDTISEMVTQGLERLIYGDGRPGSRRSPNRTYGSSYTNYNRYSRERSVGSSIREERPGLSARRTDDDEWIFRSRADAQAVLEQMYETLEEYKLVSMADLKAMCEKPSTHIDQKWGWENLQGSEIRITRGGYLLILPKTIPLD